MDLVQEGSPTDFRRLCIIAQPKVSPVLVLRWKWKRNVKIMQKMRLKCAVEFNSIASMNWHFIYQNSKNLLLKVVGIFAESFNIPISQYNSCRIYRDIFILMEWYMLCVIAVDLLEWRCYYIGHISLNYCICLCVCAKSIVYYRWNSFQLRSNRVWVHVHF